MFQYSAVKHQRNLQKALVPFLLSSSNFFIFFLSSLFRLYLRFVFFYLLLFILVFSLLSPYFFRSVFASSFCRSCFHPHISYVFSSFRYSCLFLSCVFVVLYSLSLSLSLSLRVSRSLAFPAAHLLMFHLANVCTWTGHLRNIKTLSSLKIHSVTRL